MAEEGFKRKLTAILSADAVDYSRLMGEDEEATVRTLKTYREVLTTLIQQHSGQVLDSPGDNLLAEFVSVVDAVQCAVAVQKEIKARNDTLPENRRMQFRIGINLGDVIQEEGRIYGDGVNIAARLEGLAEPGGICISKTAFDHIESKLPYGYDFLGDQPVKNISKPIGAYRVLMDPRVTASGKPVDVKPPIFRQRSIIVGAVAVLVVVVALVIWQFYNSRLSTEPLSADKQILSQTEKPSIAVMPFKNMSGDPEYDYIGDGISENIISTLSKIPYLSVMSRNSTFFYKDKPVQISQVGRELGVKYVLEGSILKSEEQIRINAQLIDAVKGNHVWSEIYNRKWTDLLSLLDEITLTVVKALTTEVGIPYPDSPIDKDTDNVEAWSFATKAGFLMERFTREDNAMAIHLAKKAIEMDPDYSIAYGQLATALTWSARYGWAASPEESMKQAKEMVLKAVEIDDSNSYAHQTLGEIYLTQRKYDDALFEFKKAVDLDPNSDLPYFRLARCLSFSGQHEEALPIVQEAISLNPNHAWTYPMVLGKIYFHTGKYEEALIEFEKVNQICKRGDCSMWLPHLYFAMVYSKLDRDKEAQYHMQKLLEILPLFSLESRRKSLLYKNKEDADREIEGLRKAGAPERPPSKG
jgi:adenylate cyclase